MLTDKINPFGTLAVPAQSQPRTFTPADSEIGRRMTGANCGNEPNAPRAMQGSREIERRKRQIEREHLRMERRNARKI